MTATIRTEQLTKRYGHVTALDGLDLEIDQGEVFGYLGPNGAGKSTTIGLLLGLLRPTSGGARIFDLDAWTDAATIHRRLAYVPSEANLWPALTGAEVLRFLADIHGSVDAAYRDELVQRFDLEVDKKIRGVQPRQPAEGGADRRVREPGRSAVARRADNRTRSADGAGLPRVRA